MNQLSLPAPSAAEYCLHPVSQRWPWTSLPRIWPALAAAHIFLHTFSHPSLPRSTCCWRICWLPGSPPCPPPSCTAPPPMSASWSCPHRRPTRRAASGAWCAAAAVLALPLRRQRPTRTKRQARVPQPTPRRRPSRRRPPPVAASSSPRHMPTRWAQWHSTSRRMRCLRRLPAPLWLAALLLPRRWARRCGPRRRRLLSRARWRRRRPRRRPRPRALVHLARWRC